MKKILNYFAVIISIVVYLLMLFVYEIDGNHLKEIKYVYILAIPCFMLLITSFFKEGKDRKRILYLYLIIYLTVLVGFVFSNARVNSALTSGIMHYYWNFIPFKSMIEMLNSPLGVTFGLYNIIGNFLMLTPLSILLPLINDKFKKTKIFLISIVGLTLFIEIVQFFVNVGSFDIDDVILNIGGAFSLYFLIKKTKLKIYLEKFFLTLKINNKRKVLKILLNIFYAGEYKTMMPKLKSTNFLGLELIRPFYYVHESDIKAWAKYLNLNFLNCACRVTNGEVSSKRQEVKELIQRLKQGNENVDIHILRSSFNVNLDSIIGYKKKNKSYYFLDDYEK